MEEQHDQPVASKLTEQPNSSDRMHSSWHLALNKWMPSALTACLVIGICRSVLEPLRQNASWMTYEEDDFFYYLKIAQNLAHGAGSTFNGIVPTNGYHPLWLMVLTLFSFFTSKPKLIFLFLSLCIAISTLATYFLARALIRLSLVGELIASALAIYIALYSIHIFTGGMEVILTVPLMLSVLLVAQHTSFWQKGWKQSTCLGLLISAMVLSRLDTLLLAMLLFIAILLHPATRRMIRQPQALGFTLGVTPLALYFLSNRIWFHTWLPISGMAKQLKTNHLPSNPAFKSLYSKTPPALLSVVVILLAIALLPAIYKRLTAAQQALYPVVLVFPFVYIFILSCLSDWRLWDWYFYALRAALCIAFALLCLWPPVLKPLRTPFVGVVVSLVMLLFIYKTHSSTGAQYQLYEVAEDVRNFAASHPGVYAMGDRSGMVAYLLPQPLVQTEGLVMDPNFLSDIRQQRPLRDTLAQYGVRYYIATSYPPYPTGCFPAVEPQQAGPASPHMTANFCEPPVKTIQQADLRTLIYDLQRPSSTSQLEHGDHERNSGESMKSR
jgi:hypothetical protein